jgi:hypothetical protein
MNINLKSNEHKQSIKHTHTPLSNTTKYNALLATATSDGADFSFHTKHTSLNYIQFTHKQKFMWGVHNTRLLAHNPILRCPMCEQFTSNGHMASNWPSSSSLRHDRHNNALQMLLSLLERHNGGELKTITAVFTSSS